MPQPKQPGPFARRWEGLAPGVRFAIVFVISSPLLYELHIHFLNQPRGRGAFYGVFWGVVVALIMLLATQNEQRRRANASDPARNVNGDGPRS
jgi:tetrahydromethanopterin S-methyltransferase subunit F